MHSIQANNTSSFDSLILQHVLETTNDVVLIVDAHEEAIIDVNRRAVELLGYSREDLCQMHIADIHPDELEEFKRFATQVDEHTVSWTDQLSCLTREGNLIPVEITATCIEAAQDQLVMICVLKTQLESSPGERTTQLSERFISDVTHELRNPLANFKLYLKLLEADPVNATKYIKTLRRESDRLDQVIHDLLRLNQINKQSQMSLQIKQTDINAIAETLVLDRSALAFEHRSITFHYHGQPDLPLCYVDPTLLEQALVILLSNARSYTPAGGHVFVQTRHEERDDEIWCSLSVSDTGIGIPPNEIDHLFERFYRSKAGRVYDMQGSGLGLSLLKDIVDLHQGSIEVHSSGVEGEGATFTIWLPQTPTSSR